MSNEPAWSQGLRRDQLVGIAAMLGIAALAWAYVIWLAGQMSPAAAGAMTEMPDMPDMPGMRMGASGMAAWAFVPWSAGHFLYMFTMWVVMMVGMMTPAVTPIVLLYARVMRPLPGVPTRIAPAAWFLCGYLAAWSLFSLVAALAQWLLEAMALLTPMMASGSHLFGGAVLVAAGLYQWTPLKQACLAHCHAPLSFLQRHGGFKADVRGALRLGFLHGLYCIGCCWALMALLFVVGVMNLLWIALLMVFVLLERALPRSGYVARGVGLVAVMVGIGLLLN